MIRQAHTYLVSAMSGATLIAIAIAVFVLLVSAQVFTDWPLRALGNGDGPAAVSDGQPLGVDDGSAAAAATTARNAAATTNRPGKGSGNDPGDGSDASSPAIAVGGTGRGDQPSGGGGEAPAAGG